MDNMGTFAHPQWSGWAYDSPSSNSFSGYTQAPSYTSYLTESMELYSAQHRHHLAPSQMSRTTETKPRLSKEEVELLEAEFQKNHKPNSSTKKALAESMRVDNARINNWFQNRRARDKKEKNIRDYAAQQKLDKDKAAAEAGDLSDNDRSNELVASSAPFPDPRRPSRAPVREMSLLSDIPTSDHNSETAETSQSEDVALVSSPDESLQDFCDNSLAVNNGCDVSIQCFSPKENTDRPDNFTLESANDYLSTAETSQSDELSVSDFGQFPQLLIPNGSGEATPSYSQRCFSDQRKLSTETSFGHYDASNYDGDRFAVAPISHTSATSLRSPPTIDIASRRNRRPPHLAISASRSYSSVIPRTGMEPGRRADVGNGMRRVASATGTVRIGKPSGTPRSPFFDRNAEVLFQLNRSPNFPATGSIAPPTPNTPVALKQQGLCEVTPSTLALDRKYPSELILLHDPTLRTPPTTPGMIDNMFALDSAYDMTISDEPLITPGLVGSFPSEFSMPCVSPSVPQYVANGRSSQPNSPAYIPQMGPAFYGFPGGNAEYNWSDGSLSARSSPARNAQFMNMTPSNFTHIE